MVDETTIMSGEVSDDRMVNIDGDEMSDYEVKVTQLSQKIAVLEQEKRQLVHENEVINGRIEKLKDSVRQTNVENEDLKMEIEKLGSENKTLQAVPARAAELEAEVSRLQHDLISVMSDLEESNKEVLVWKSKVESLENGKTDKSVQLEAIKNERDLLISKLETLEAREREKEEVIRGLEKEIQELKVVAKDREVAEKTVKVLLGKVEEKERIICGLEEKQRAIGKINEEEAIVAAKDQWSAVVEGERDKLLGGLKVEWPVVAVSSVGAIAVVGVVFYLHYARKR